MRADYYLKITKQIDQIHKKLELVQNQQELLALIHPFCTRGVYQYHAVTCIMLIAGLLIACILLLSLTPDLPSMALGLLICFIFGGIYVFAIRYSLLKKLENAIVLKAMSFRHGFSIEAQLPEELRVFKDLDRGDYSRTIEQVTKSTYEGSLHTISYYSCHLHYVNKKSSSNSGSEYEHYDRYYLFLAFPWINGITLRSDSLSKIDLPVRYKSTLADFNCYFRLTGNSEMACARFAKPITIIHLLKFKDILENPNFTFSDNGWLCVGYNNEYLLNSEVNFSLISNPVLFYNMIVAGIDRPRLQKFFQLIHQLAEQHDDNFNLS